MTHPHSEGDEYDGKARDDYGRPQPETYYLLLAERDGERVHPTDCACYFDTMEAAAETVERWDENGRWPEGYDAVLVKDGKEWFYDDNCWSPLD